MAERSKSGQFLPGHKGVGGRPLGSRNRLGEKFLDDLQAIWKKKGRAALERVASDDPATLVKVVASVLPRQLIAETNLNVDVTLFHDARNFQEAFRLAKSYLRINGDGDGPPMIEATAESDGDDDGITAN